MKKSVILILSILSGIIVGAGTVTTVAKKRESKIQLMSEKHLALFLMMNQWVKIKQKDKSLAMYLKNAGYKNIAIYGMSYIGETVISELKNTGIQVEYGIDKNSDSIYSDIKIMSIDDKLKNVDAVLVTAITFFDEIEKDLSKKLDCPIISLENILYDIK